VGKVVLCQRGAASFLVKSQNVAGSGGLAAVIYNNVAGPLSGTLGDDLSVIPAIPVTGIAMTDGQDLLASHIAESTTVNTQLQVITNSYEIYNGTSMATPHVVGVAALIWSANPSWTNQQIREALEVTAEDLGAPGHDPAYGWGLIRAKDALDYLESQ
jgi:subtilisin family serine protease